MPQYRLVIERMLHVIVSSYYFILLYHCSLFYYYCFVNKGWRVINDLIALQVHLRAQAQSVSTIGRVQRARHCCTPLTLRIGLSACLIRRHRIWWWNWWGAWQYYGGGLLLCSRCVSDQRSGLSSSINGRTLAIHVPFGTVPERVPGFPVRNVPVPMST